MPLNFHKLYRAVKSLDKRNKEYRNILQVKAFPLFYNWRFTRI